MAYRKIDRQVNRLMENIQIDYLIKRQIGNGIKKDRQTGKQIDGKIYRQIVIQKDRQTYRIIKRCLRTDLDNF